VKLQTWQEGAHVSLDFGDVEIQASQLWGATLVEDDDGSPPGVVHVRLLPFNHHTPTDRRSSFGFDATPPFHELPFISCVPSRPFPPPPPPSAPSPPPSPPPFHVTERDECFLGGRVTFLKSPDEKPGTLWEVEVELDTWMVGAQLTLDFFGKSLKQHPLRLSYACTTVVNHNA
jgi:hypothetical protein